MFTTVSISDNELAAKVKHEGIRAGEIIAYRAWRVATSGTPMSQPPAMCERTGSTRSGT